MIDHDERERLHRLELGQTKIEARIERLAEQSWVHEILTPIKEAIGEMRYSVTELAKEMKLLLATQDQLLREEAERKKELHKRQLEALEQKTPMALVKSIVIPACALLTGGAAAYLVLQQILKAIVVGH